MFFQDHVVSLKDFKNLAISKSDFNLRPNNFYWHHMVRLLSASTKIFYHYTHLFDYTFPLEHFWVKGCCNNGSLIVPFKYLLVVIYFSETYKILIKYDCMTKTYR